MTLVSLGYELGALPVRLEYVRTLEFFEGERLAEYRTPTGEPYLSVWFDSAGPVVRRLLVRTTEVELAKFLAGQRSLRDILGNARDGAVYAVDSRRDEEKPVRVAFLPIAQLPAHLVPAEDSFYDESLALATVASQQTILLDGGWSVTLLSRLERRYQQVYAFLALAGHTFVNPTVAGKFEHYRVKGGWVQHTIFDQLVHHLLPQTLLPKVHAMHYASPGVLQYEVEPEVAHRVRSAIQRIGERGVESRKHYEALHSVLLELGRAHDKGDEDAVRRLRRSIVEPARALAAELGFVDIEQIWSAAGGNPENGGHLLATYWRRLAELYSYAAENRAKLL